MEDQTRFVSRDLCVMDEDESISILEETSPTNADCHDSNPVDIPEFQIYTNHPKDLEEASHYALNLTCHTLQKRNRELESEIQRLHKLKPKHLECDALKIMADTRQQLEEQIQELETSNANLHKKISNLMTERIWLKNQLASKCKELDEVKSACSIGHVKKIQELERLLLDKESDLLQMKSSSRGILDQKNILPSAFKDPTTEDDQSPQGLRRELCLLQNELCEMQDIVKEQSVIIKQLINEKKAQQEKQLGSSKNEFSTKNHVSHPTVHKRNPHDTEPQCNVFKILCDPNTRDVFTQPPVFSINNIPEDDIVSQSSHSSRQKQIAYPPNSDTWSMLNGSNIEDRFGLQLEADGQTTESGDNRLSQQTPTADLNQSIEIENNLYTSLRKIPCNRMQTINLNKTASDNQQEMMPQCSYEVIHNGSLGAAKCIPPENIYTTTRCPTCKASFSGKTKEADFKLHVMMCSAGAQPSSEKVHLIDTDSIRECPVCNQVFPPPINQREFEEHVHSHFEPEFEQL